MKTITLKVSDSYFDSFMSFLNMLPKKAVRIEKTEEQKKLEAFEADIKEAFEDVRLGRVTKTGKTIQLKS
jgi:hypothetical protein